MSGFAAHLAEPLSEEGRCVRAIDDRTMERLADGCGIAPEPRCVRETHRAPDGTESTLFDHEMALAALLINEAVLVGSHEDGGIALLVNCSDVFAWGYADCEELPHGELEAVYDAWLRDPIWGTAVWCMRRRGELPQAPVATRVRHAGIWDLDAMGLRGNAYDGLCRKWAAERAAPINNWENEGGSCRGAD